jgi:hypothetical protein
MNNIAEAKNSAHFGEIPVKKAMRLLYEHDYCRAHNAAIVLDWL